MIFLKNMAPATFLVRINPISTRNQLFVLFTLLLLIKYQIIVVKHTNYITTHNNRKKIIVVKHTNYITTHNNRKKIIVVKHTNYITTHNNRKKIIIGEKHGESAKIHRYCHF